MINNISILGSGWLGLPLAKKLSKHYKIKISTTKKDKLDLLNKNHIDAFLYDINCLSNNLKFLNSELLIINITSKDILAYKRLIEKINESSIKKVIFISSSSVYKDSKELINEKAELNNNSLVDIEKQFLEQDSFQTTILRFAGLIGYDRNIAKYFQTKTVQNSNSPVNLIHRDDCITIIEKIIKKGVSKEIFNCCSSSHPSKKEFYSYCAKKVGIDIFAYDGKNDKYKIIDNTKIKHYLNFNFKYDDLFKIFD